MDIHIGRYQPYQGELPAQAHDPADTWDGWIEPDDKSWIMFIATDGSPTIWLHRDENGGVIGDPVTR